MKNGPATRGGPLLVAFVVLLAVGVPVAVFGPGYVRYREAQRLLATGASATATATGVRDAGNRFNDSPEVAVTVEVHAAGQLPWQATFIRVMDFGAVRYDPNQRELLTPGP